jgi:hypothetical protein
MELTITERIIIQSILIDKGGLVELALAKSIRNKTAFTAEDIERFEMKDTEIGTQWNPAKDVAVEIAFTVDEIGVIKKSIKIKDANEELYIDAVDFCNKVLEM